MPPYGHEPVRLDKNTYTRSLDGGSDINAHENVVFWNEPVLQPAESDAAGREIYKDQEMWELRFPGNNLTVYTGKVTENEKARWPRQYEAFKKSGSFAVGIAGTPLEQWPFVGRSTIAELRYLNILTVEMLAAVDDNGIGRIGPGGRKLVETARAWLKEAEDGAATIQLAATKAALEDQVRVQDGKIAELTALLSQVTTQLQQITTAGAMGVGPGHLASIGSPAYAVAAPAPVLAPSAIESSGAPEFKPRGKPGRPSNAEIAARSTAA